MYPGLEKAVCHIQLTEYLAFSAVAQDFCNARQGVAIRYGVVIKGLIIVYPLR